MASAPEQRLVECQMLRQHLSLRKVGPRVVGQGAVQIHGGSGFMRDTEVNRLYRTGRVLEVGAGTQEVRKLIIAGELLRN